MRRITTWVTATLAVVAMITYYQVSLSGDGKHAEGAARQPVAADCGGARPQTATTPRASADPSTATSADKSGDLCANSDHTGKPGESKWNRVTERLADAT